MYKGKLCKCIHRIKYQRLLPTWTLVSVNLLVPGLLFSRNQYYPFYPQLTQFTPPVNLNKQAISWQYTYIISNLADTKEGANTPATGWSLAGAWLELWWIILEFFVSIFCSGHALAWPLPGGSKMIINAYRFKTFFFYFSLVC